MLKTPFRSRTRTRQSSGSQAPAQPSPSLEMRIQRLADTSRSPAPEPEPGSAVESQLDEATYTCGCGFIFSAPVLTSVDCPHCGDAQAW